MNNTAKGKFMRKILILSLVFIMLGGNTVQANTQSKVLLQQRQRITYVKSTTEGKRIFKLVDKYSKQYKVDKRLVHAIIMVESNYRTNIPRKKGACAGLMQLDPYFARKKGCKNVYDIEQNIKYGTKHFAGLLAKYKGNEKLALAAYNCGGGYVDRFHGKVPPSARKYVNKVLSFKKLI